MQDDRTESFIGKITGIEMDDSQQVVLSVRWYYRPEETGMWVGLGWVEGLGWVLGWAGWNGVKWAGWNGWNGLSLKPGVDIGTVDLPGGGAWH